MVLFITGLVTTVVGQIGLNTMMVGPEGGVEANEAGLTPGEMMPISTERGSLNLALRLS